VWAQVFEPELFRWHIDESLWPKRRSLSMFRGCVMIERHTVIKNLYAWPLPERRPITNANSPVVH
jgi:hypothetical protein